MIQLTESRWEEINRQMKQLLRISAAAKRFVDFVGSQRFEPGNTQYAEIQKVPGFKQLWESIYGETPETNEVPTKQLGGTVTIVATNSYPESSRQDTDRGERNVFDSLQPNPRPDIDPARRVCPACGGVDRHFRDCNTLPNPDPHFRQPSGEGGWTGTG